MKTNCLKFYADKFKIFDDVDALDLSDIPPIIRRRMSKLDKMTFSALEVVFTDSVQNVVYSSQFGEVDRLLKIIDQYTECDEVSPNTFSCSVHNYPVSFFLLNKHLSVPYTALSSHENSISSGLLVSLISDYDNVLFCYSDVNKGSAVSLGINLNKKEGNKEYILKFKTNDSVRDSFYDYVKFFSGETLSLETPIYTIERADK